MTGEPDLVRQILEGDQRELKLLAAQGLVPLTPSEILPLQVRLTTDTDPQVASAAEEALVALEPGRVIDQIEDGAPTEVLSFYARRGEPEKVVEAILRRKDVPAGILADLAPALPPDQQEVLLLRQDLIVSAPRILDALGKNPRLSSYSRRRIDEYRQHLIPRERAAKTTEEIEAEADSLSAAEVEAAIEEARGAVESQGEVDEETGLADSQVRSLPVPVRLKLSRGAPTGLRNLLIRDPNPLVATSVLRNNTIQDAEIERIAASRQVVPEVLEAISRNRQWTRKYSVAVALVRNPRTPVGIAVRYLSRIAVRDLALLKRDRNVSHAVREAAQRLSRIKRS